MKSFVSFYKPEWAKAYAQYDVAKAHFDDNCRSLYSDLMDRELDAGTRVVMNTDRFVVFHPFASYRPFETWIMPKADQASFSQISILSFSN